MTFDCMYCYAQNEFATDPYDNRLEYYVDCEECGKENRIYVGPGCDV